MIRPSSPPEDADAEAAGRLTGGRYRLQGQLGRGGMAVVLAATEVATGRKLALKRLQPHPDPHKHQRNAELFEREFHALSQLTHPRIVSVYDYGIDDSGPYYTMELLDGGDLQQLAPLDWRTACAIARGLCSALSLLHSRRLVHRDLSPRNVRKTADGLAKLIDFGALAPLGPNKVIVGTPPCCAPESVRLQPLDGRTDLFALGATLYYMLVGRHAYVARELAMLHDAWQAGFAPPSRLVPDIPESLDALVLDLLRLEPDARPANAAEVIQRLCAIDGEPLEEQLQVAEAYLSMPLLVGRGPQLRRVRRRVARATHGRGCAMLIEGPAGVGRSRFLDACVLDATLQGTAAVRGDADDSLHGDYGLVRALAKQLMTMLPSAAAETAQPQLSLLAQVIPDLRPAEVPSGPAATRPQLQAAVHAWLEALARKTPLLIAVDDFDRVDEPSAALLALLAHDSTAPLCLLVSSERGAASTPAQQLLLEVATRIELENLTPEDSEELLKSLFGEVPNAGTIAHRLHELAHGNPGNLLRLAQHLIDRRVARYEAGAWTLGQRIDEADLPSSMMQALRERIDAVSVAARELACAFALCPDQSFNLDESSRLHERADSSSLMRDLDSLIAAEIVHRVEDQYRLSRTSWAPALRAGLDSELERSLHARLAGVLQARGHDFRASQHWLRAGEYAKGLDVLVAHAAVSQEQTAKSSEVFLRYARSLPVDWLETYVEALQLCERLGRPKRDAFLLRGRLSGLAPAFSVSDTTTLAGMYKQLSHDSGLDDWHALPSSLDPQTRIQTAMASAAARYLASDSHDRVLEPAVALRVFGRALLAAATRVANGLDVPYLRSLPTLEPFAPISPGLATLHALTSGIEARYTGRPHRTMALYRDVLERIERPDRAGLDGSYAEILRLSMMNALAMMEACHGLASSLARIERVAETAAYRFNASHARLLYHLYQGDVRAADLGRKQQERMRLEEIQLYSGAHVLWEIDAHVMAEDLTHLRYVLEQCVPLAAAYDAWKVVQYYAQAEYHRIRRDPARAREHIEHALALAQPGVHVSWASVASTHVRVLGDLGLLEQAFERAEAYVATADANDLAFVAEPLRLMLGLCQVRANRPEGASTIDAVIARHAALGVEGMHLGFAHEARARAALLLKNEAAFAHHAELCRAVYCRHVNPALRAKYERLCQEAEQRRVAAPIQIGGSTPDSLNAYTEMRIVAALEHCTTDEQRAKLALVILVRQSASRAGVLFTVGADAQPALTSIVGELDAPPTLLPRVTAWLLAHARGGDTTSSDTMSQGQTGRRQAWIVEAGETYRPVLLSHDIGGSWVVMGVALLVASETAPFRHPLQLARMVSRFWANCGHSSILQMED